MEIKILKLVNGDDVISSVEYDGGEERYDGGEVKLSNPAKLMMFPSEEGGMAMALIPWCPYSDDEEFEIDERNILVSISPSDELRESYNQQFGSGLTTPPTDIIY